MACLPNLDDDDDFGGDLTATNSTRRSGNRRRFGDLEDDEENIFGRTKSEVEETAPGVATGMIFSLHESLLECKDTLAICQTELEVAKSEIQKWHAAFQNESFVPAGTSPEPRLVVSYLQELKSSEESVKEQLEKAKKKEAAFIVIVANREQEISELKSVVRDLRAQPKPPSMQNLVEEKEKKVKELQDKIAAVNFTPHSKMGKLLMAKCRTVQEENEEIGTQAKEGKIHEVSMKLPLQKSQFENLRSQFEGKEGSRDFKGKQNEKENVMKCKVPLKSRNEKENAMKCKVPLKSRKSFMLPTISAASKVKDPPSGFHKHFCSSSMSPVIAPKSPYGDTPNKANIVTEETDSSAASKAEADKIQICEPTLTFFPISTPIPKPCPIAKVKCKEDEEAQRAPKPGFFTRSKCVSLLLVLLIACLAIFVTGFSINSLHVPPVQFCNLTNSQEHLGGYFEVNHQKKGELLDPEKKERDGVFLAFVNTVIDNPDVNEHNEEELKVPEMVQPGMYNEHLTDSVPVQFCTLIDSQEHLGKMNYFEIAENILDLENIDIELLKAESEEAAPEFSADTETSSEMWKLNYLTCAIWGLFFLLVLASTYKGLKQREEMNKSQRQVRKSMAYTKRESLASSPSYGSLTAGGDEEIVIPVRCSSRIRVLNQPKGAVPSNAVQDSEIEKEQDVSNEPPVLPCEPAKREDIRVLNQSEGAVPSNAVKDSETEKEQDVCNEPPVLPCEPEKSIDIDVAESSGKKKKHGKRQNKKNLWSIAEEVALVEGIQLFAPNNARIPWKKILKFGGDVYNNRTAKGLERKWSKLCKRSPL